MPRIAQPGVGEFVALLALLTSLTALSIDALLPALRLMGEALAVPDVRDLQLIVSIFIGGMVLGEIVAGPLSDAIGRRRTVVIGLMIYAAGTLVSMQATSVETVLAGRFVQGIGVAGSKIASRAMIRDRYVGDEMARIASFIFTLFIVVPMLAPFVGQLVLEVAGWQAIFGLYLAVTVVCGVWLLSRQPETLPPERRIPLDVRRLGGNLAAILRHRRVMACTLAAGCVFGAHLLWLSIAPTLLDDAYGVRDRFPAYFAVLAASAGLAALLNGLVVRRFGAYRVAVVALGLMIVAGGVVLLLDLVFVAAPPIAAFMGCGLALFACIGLLFGNLNALAMESLGAMAGVGSSVIASVSSLVAVLIAVSLGRFYDGHVALIGLGFLVAGVVALALLASVGREAAGPVAVRSIDAALEEGRVLPPS